MRRLGMGSFIPPRLALILVLAIFGEAAVAGPSSGNFVHWAYSAYFGTGWYQVANAQDVFVMRFSPRWHWREAAFDEDGGRKVGLEFRLPVTFGVHRFDGLEIPGIIDIDNFGSASVTPGVEIDIPVTERWSLKPLAYLGWGTELNGHQSAWSYWTVVKSRYLLGGDGLKLSLGNCLAYIGYTPNDGPSSDAVPVMAGLEFQWPVDGGRLGVKPFDIEGHVLYTAYMDNLNFLFGGVSSAKIADEWELGLAIGKGPGKISFWHLEWDRIGLAYRFSGSGEFDGVSLVFRSVFDR